MGMTDDSAHGANVIQELMSHLGMNHLEDLFSAVIPRGTHNDYTYKRMIAESIENYRYKGIVPLQVFGRHSELFAGTRAA